MWCVTSRSLPFIETPLWCVTWRPGRNRTVCQDHAIAGACLDLQTDSCGAFPYSVAFMRTSVCLLKPRVLCSYRWSGFLIQTQVLRNVIWFAVWRPRTCIFHISRVINVDLRVFDPYTHRRSLRHGSRRLNGETVSRIPESPSYWTCLFPAKHCARVHLQTDSTACWIVSGAKHATWEVCKGYFVFKNPE